VKTRIRFSPTADRTFSALPRRVQAQFNDVLSTLEEGPFRRAPGLDVRQMRNYRDIWRVRLGEYPGVFRWDGSELRFLKFVHRRVVYHGLPETARE
jgi:mRNA-degrading endonuclease RelE of RelBE toxin-antitoxin system